MNKILVNLLCIAGIVLCLMSCGPLKTNSVDASVLVLNKGVGGNSTNDLLKRLETDVLNERPNLVILMVGTNDLLNSGKMISYDSYTSNLNTIVQTLKSNNIQVIMLSPPPVDSVYLFQRHDKKIFKESPNVKMNSARKIVEQIANENKALYINIYEAFNSKGLPIHNEDLYIRNVKNSNVKDGVHPTPLGYKLIAETVFQYLEENKLSHKYHKIICFGDSITKGAGAKGGGPFNGENYPSFLNQMINNIN